ncbi:MAG: hypothetical protein LBD52_03875 [Prevotellaceae bacterium]|jgi:enterochelin esterase-like enzyme|nr:hypothetical protein [Prevotellaceae bacterium]
MQKNIYNFFLCHFLILLECHVVLGQAHYVEIAHSLNVSSGTVKRFYVESEWVENRNVDVWLPESFSSDKQYAVCYMHDGQNLFDAGGVWNSKEWQVDETVGKLMAQQEIEDVIVVGIWNNGRKRYTEYFPQKAIEYIEEPFRNQLLALFLECPLADRYLQFIVTELKPFIDHTFPTFPEQGKTFISGSSLGALISLYALCEYPQVFYGAACLSTHWIGTFDYNEEIPAGICAYLEQSLPSPENHAIYFDYGTVGLDANYPEFQKNIDTVVKQKSYDDTSWTTIEFPGEDHNEKYWANRFHIPLIFLLENKLKQP